VGILVLEDYTIMMVLLGLKNSQLEIMIKNGVVLEYHITEINI